MCMKAQHAPMGWNSWNTFGKDINEEIVRGAADKIVETGLRDAGYEYVIIDDYWSEKQRDADGRLVPNHEKFPHGMKALGDYIHQRGLKFGMYSCAGVMTCASFPGSFEHEFTDAETFANYGVDYLKYDYCFHPSSVPDSVLYKRMAIAIRNCGRDILFAACNWGSDHSEQWMAESGADSFRSTGDIQDNWQSVKSRAQQQVTGKALPFGRPFCYNDLDMLVVGMKGKGHVSLGGCTNEEYKTHFALWCMHSSPLIIGCDVRSMDEETKDILTNRELIAIDQDIEARPPFLVSDPSGIEYQGIYVKMLSDGSMAICFVNYSDAPINLTIPFFDIGLPGDCGYGLKFRDLWAHEDVGVYHGSFTCSNIAPHASCIYKASVVKL